jgi:hypothetical protein
MESTILEQTGGQQSMTPDVQVQLKPVAADREEMLCVLTRALFGANATSVYEEILSRGQPGDPQRDDVVAVPKHKPGFTSKESGLWGDVDHRVTSPRSPIS